MRKVLFPILSLLTLVIFLISCGGSKNQHRYLNKNYQEFKKAFPDAQVNLIHDSIKIIFPNNVIFDVSSAVVKSSFNDKLKRFSKILNKFDKTNILINGYTDNSGSEETNLSLSLKRANNVKKNLVSKNVLTERLFTWGIGEKNPIASNETKAGRKLNRRVEFVVLYEPKK